MILRALVIDDSRIMRNMVMETLKKTELAEFEFQEANDGAEAVERFDADKTDIVFVDWNMPKMNGIEFARHLRSLSWASHIPVIMVTSEKADSKQEAAYAEARIMCYITKPFTVDQMKEKVAPIIEKISTRKDQGTAKTVASVPSAKPTGGFFSKLIG